MNGITILIWITIALIAVISIIGVKLHYRGDQLEHEEGSILPSGKNINKAISVGRNRIAPKNNAPSRNRSRSLSPVNAQQNRNTNLFRKKSTTAPKNDSYIVPEVEKNNSPNYEYESQNQVLINYDNTVEKFQEPIKQNQMDIMTQNNNNKDEDATELKDLFTIDELIKESKRKDTEREKESQRIKKEQEEDEELSDIKKSIKEKKENKSEEPLIEEIIKEDEKEETIGDLIKEEPAEAEEAAEEKVEEKVEEKAEEIETPLSTSQKEIDEVITSASNEVKDEIESIAEEETITEAVIDKKDEQRTLDEITEPTLKTPNKVEKPKAEAESDANSGEGDEMDLDYRKDLNKVANKIKGSRIYQDVKEKLIPEKEEEIPPRDDETYIRNVNEYDEYEPIINETHIDYEKEFDMDYDRRLREANTRRLRARITPEPELAKPKVGSIKDKPSRENIKIQINNNEIVLKKGDEIIFNHLGETYSSQVYAINGDDISVKYRRQNITIKPSDVKKVY